MSMGAVVDSLVHVVNTETRDRRDSRAIEREGGRVKSSEGVRMRERAMYMRRPPL